MVMDWQNTRGCMAGQSYICYESYIISHIQFQLVSDTRSAIQALSVSAFWMYTIPGPVELNR